ncbi:MAG: SUMF1/EgtB/PvdO family nonheme iron enzyme [Myxococcales bacterium]|nr:SUMF1/EgtB/PvdO family nonheme iron enzyme [Myxococcales bacterium]
MLNLRPGTVLGDKLRLAEPLGQGGMGHVWRADHLSLDTQVAVKFIRPDRAADPKLVERFSQEAKAAARIASAHVVRIHDFGLVDHETPYIVMELLHGDSLDAVLAAETRLSLERVTTIVSDVAAALTAAHALGIVHRDVKPQNIFLTRSPSGLLGLVKVLDFGVAKMLGDAQVPGGSELTETGTVIGSPPYMSPEQIEGHAIDARADLWSLGVVAYRCLTGRLPFEGGSFVAVGSKVLAGRYTPIVELRPDLPDAIDHWLAKVFSVDPEGRFASATAMAEALTRIADEAPASAAPPPLARPLELGDDTASHAEPAPPLPETHSSITLDRPTQDRPSAPATSWSRRAALFTVAAALTLGGGYWATTRPRPEVEPANAAPPPPLTAADCPEGMAFIAGGSFAMGSEAGPEVRKNETPRHTVELPAYCLDRTEVTVADYTRCESCGPVPVTVDGKEVTRRAQEFWSEFCNGGRAERGDHPMNCVSWSQAAAYCEAQGKRLPSEEEWEVAARGRDDRPYPWGAEPPAPSLVNACGAECSELLTRRLEPLGQERWLRLHDGDDGAPTTAAVGHYPAGASPAGVLDMAGNVWEWTASAYCYYDDKGCLESRRVLRGGGWDVPDAAAMRVTRRHPGEPTGRGHNIGFRCAWSRP